MHTLDGDALAHELYRPGGSAVAAVARLFGEGVLGADGGIDRKELGKRVWAEPDARSKLSALMWPRILRLAQRRAVEAARADASTGGAASGVVVLEAAVLLEAGWDDCCDEVWLVSASPDAQRERLARRDAISAGEIEARLSAQMRPEERARRADVVLSTELDEIGGDGEGADAALADGARSPLGAQLDRAVAGARARAALRLDDSAEGSAARAWWDLCAQLGVPPPAARRWWRRLYASYSREERHYHDVGWMREVVGAVRARRAEASRPEALLLAAFFCAADDLADDLADEVSARSDPPLARFARLAPRLSPRDAALAAEWAARPRVGRAETPREEAGETGEVDEPDLSILLHATRRDLASRPPEYARHAARLELERQCAADDEGATALRRRRIAEIRSLLDEPAGGIAVGDGDEVARANLREELERIISD